MNREATVDWLSKIGPTLYLCAMFWMLWLSLLLSTDGHRVGHLTLSYAIEQPQKLTPNEFPRESDDVGYPEKHCKTSILYKYQHTDTRANDTVSECT